MSTDLHELQPDCTIDINLTTFPQNQEQAFDKSVIEKLYNDYRAGVPKNCIDGFPRYGEGPNFPGVKALYVPLCYHLFGQYDIAYIALIDNLKFQQKLFEPTLQQDGAELLYPHSHQGITGITHETKDRLYDFFGAHLQTGPDQKRPYFVGIIKTKLNNALLLGNGSDYLKVVTRMIRKQITRINIKNKNPAECLILHSFAVFDLTLLVFTDSPDTILSILEALRSLNFKDLKSEPEYDQLLKDSLYRELLPKKSAEELSEANLFADTHSHIGIHSDLVRAEENDPYLVEFRKKNIRLRSNIQWQVRPGHMDQLGSILQKLFNTPAKDCLMLIGKTDYALNHVFLHANDNLLLARAMRNNPQTFYNHIRRLRTQVEFKRNNAMPKKIRDKVLPLQDSLRPLAESVSSIHRLAEMLRSMKVARPIREKVLKLFSNYNNGIQDPILFVFFSDFTVFVKELKRLIVAQFTDFSQSGAKTPYDLGQLELALINRIKIFQEACNNRLQNCYLFEDIIDFDTDYNGSIQQLLTAYNVLVMEVGSIFYDPPEEYGPVVRINLTDTVANYYSINYFVHHLTSPEFVFATMVAEIQNIFSFDSSRIKEFFQSYQQFMPLMQEKYYDLYLSHQEDIINVQRLLMDIVRFVLSFNLEPGLFIHWFWTYNLQHTSLFDKTGTMNVDHFKKELFRIRFIMNLFGFPDQGCKSPIPDLENLWHRHFAETEKLVNRYIDFLTKSKIGKPWIRMLQKIIFDSLGRIMPPMDDHWVRDEAALKKGKLFATVLDADILMEANYFMMRDMLYREWEEGKQPEPGQEALHIHWKMHNYLTVLYEGNHRQIKFLQRDWLSGQPLSNFIKAAESDHIYLVDQTGGLFFDQIPELNRYFRQTMEMLEYLWHHACKMKKNFLIKKIQQNEPPANP